MKGKTNKGLKIICLNRKAVIIYKRKIMFSSQGSSESSDSSKPKEVKKPDQLKQLS